MVVGTIERQYDTFVSRVGLAGVPVENRAEVIDTIGQLTFPEDTVINERYRLKVGLIVEVRTEGDKYLLVNHQVDEYGIGNSLEEAEQDFLDSLVDYLVSLEKREHRLADKELRKLQLLRDVLVKR